MTARTDSAIIFPRGFGKSTWEKIDTIHDIVYRHEPVILYVSSTLRDAQFHFESIKFELENNELLRRIYGNLVPPESNLGRKWTNIHLETVNGVNLVARYAGKGRGVNIRNRRPTKIVLDDIENDDAVRNPDLRKKLENWIDGVIIPSKDRLLGFVKMIGTVLHPECALLRFKAKNGGIQRAAIEDGASIWPEAWPLEKLEKLKTQIGSLLFQQEYLNIPISASERMVKDAWIRKVPRPPMKRHDSNGNVVPAVDTYGHIDPAISEKQTADYTALCTVFRDLETGRITVADIERGHLSFHEQGLLMRRKHAAFKFRRLGIETVAYQAALKQEIDRLGPIEGSYLPTHAFVPDKDKVRGLHRVLPFMENGTVVFADDLPQEFFDELVQFPNGKNDDMVDAMVNAIVLAMEQPNLEVIML